MNIRQRTKMSVIKVEDSFLPPFENHKLEINALPEAWIKLYIISLIKPDDILRTIRNFSKAAYDHINAKPGRGPHAGREDFVRMIKQIATYIYCWTEYWLKKPEKEWPIGLEGIIKEAGGQLGGPSHFGRLKKGRHTVLVTACIMEKHFGKERRKQGLKRFTEDVDAFRRTYIATTDFTRYIKTKSQELIDKGVFDTSFPPL